MESIEGLNSNLELPQMTKTFNQDSKELIIKSKRKNFLSFEELILTLKTELLADKQRLISISKKLADLFKDRSVDKLPEKILDVFKFFKVILDPRDQK